MRLAVGIVVATLLAAVHAAADCSSLEGWKRIVELYSGHWDAVSFINFASDTSSTSGGLFDAALCGAPLVFNAYNVPDSLVPSNAKDCNGSGWYDRATGTCRDEPYAGKGKGPIESWRRLALPRRSRIHLQGNIPAAADINWINDQHSSPDLRPADVVVYNLLGMTDPAPFVDHISAQLEETAHAILFYGDLCREESPLRKAVFGIGGGSTPEIIYCHEDDTNKDEGLMVMRRGGLVMAGSLVNFESMLAAPVHLSPEDLFLIPEAFKRTTVIYKVPETCINRLATSPLQHMYREEDGTLKSEAQSRVQGKYLHQDNFRAATVHSASSFRHTHYSGLYCGITVFSNLFSNQRQMLFYTIGTPVVESWNELGLHSLLRYDNTPYRPRVPVIHTYFHYEIPKGPARERRYFAYQLEYAPGKIRSNGCLHFMQNAVVPLEYTQNQLKHWHDKGVENVKQLPLCYHPSIEYNLPPAPKPVSHALFPGIIRAKPRREWIMGNMTEAGINIRYRSYLRHDEHGPKFGVEDMIDGLNSEVIVNFHAYADSGVGELEVPRLTPYLSNGMFVISEQGSEPDQKKMLEKALVFVPDGETEMKPDLVRQWVGEENEAKRAAVAANAREVMRTTMACLKNPTMLDTLDTMAMAAFPRWYLESFYLRVGELPKAE